jgi:hypothetical protein
MSSRERVVRALGREAPATRPCCTLPPAFLRLTERGKTNTIRPVGRIAPPEQEDDGRARPPQRPRTRTRFARRRRDKDDAWAAAPPPAH